MRAAAIGFRVGAREQSCCLHMSRKVPVRSIVLPSVDIGTSDNYVAPNI
jgi:hypothetical protein